MLLVPHSSFSSVFQNQIQINKQYLNSNKETLLLEQQLSGEEHLALLQKTWIHTGISKDTQKEETLTTNRYTQSKQVELAGNIPKTWW